MARKKKRIPSASTISFDVFYEDGTRTSHRKVPAADLGGLDGDEPAMTFIVDQDRKIAELSGKAPRVIKRLVRSEA
jgi:hypothetical protein